MPELNNQKIYFAENTAEIISSILQKYNMDETGEELEKKLHSEKPSPLNGAIVLNITIMAVRKKISEKDFAPTLQKELGTTPKIAEDLANDIKTRLIPIATDKKPVPKSDEDLLLEKIKPPIGLPKIGEEIKNVITPQKPTVDSKKDFTAKKEKVKETIMPENNKKFPPKPKQPRGPDNYRELIE